MEENSNRNQKFIWGSGVIAILAALLFYFSSITGKPVEISTTSALSEDSDSMPIDLISSDMYTGNLLAGSVDFVPYIEFNNQDFQQAIAEDKVIFLEFYATWCPTCRAQERAFLPAFDMIERNDVIAFRVNYNDPETDPIEESLAERFGVTYQHHKVILKGEEEILNINEIWDKNTLIQTLSSL